MRRVLLALVAIGMAATLSACVPDSGSGPSQSGLPSIDPSLIPQAPPANVVDVPEAQFQANYGDYIFKIGQGPVWCSINVDNQFVVCEQNEVTAQYEPIPVPSTCQFSYGYQVRLWQTKPKDAEGTAEFMCSGGAYADPSNAKTLNAGERVKVAGFDCWVSEMTARCENGKGNYIVLGPSAWALGNS